MVVFSCSVHQPRSKSHRCQAPRLHPALDLSCGYLSRCLGAQTLWQNTVPMSLAYSPRQGTQLHYLLFGVGHAFARSLSEEGCPALKTRLAFSPQSFLISLTKSK